MPTIRLWRKSSNAIDVLDVEEYLRGVVPAEMPASWPIEALKAQAVAARTYALAAIAHPRYPPDADLDDTARTQAYVDRRYDDTNAAVDATRGETWPGDCLYVNYCGRQDCPLCLGTGGYNGQTWTGRLCQWGARYMALQGKSYHEILAHYYGGAPIAPVEATTVASYSAYPRPPHSTGAGVHGGANGSFPMGETSGDHVCDYAGQPVYRAFLDTCLLWRSMGFSWVKLVTIDDAALKCLPSILYAGLMPVLRMFMDHPAVVSAYTEKQLATLRQGASVGLWYIEDDNERNLEGEWPSGQWPGVAMPFDVLVAAWAARAEVVRSMGMRLAIPALSPGGNYEDIAFLTKWLKAALANPRAKAQLQGAWVSVHNAGLNHPLDYPDDAVNRREHPGQTIHTHYYADGSPTGASNCIRKWEAVHQLVLDITGLDLPVLCTEGGYWPGNKADDRYAELTEQASSDLQATALRQMQMAPAYLFAMMPWLWSNKHWGNPAGHFERDSWDRSPGYGDCPSWEPAQRAVIAMLKANPCKERSTDVTNTQLARAKKELEKVAFLDKVAKLHSLIWCGFEYAEDGQTVTLAQKMGTMDYYRVAVPTGQWDASKAVIELVA